MRPTLRLAALAVVLISACGQVEPVTVAVSMPECVYRGSDSMREGTVSVSLTLNGVTDAGATLVLIENDHSYDDLVAEVARTGEVPDWALPLVELELSHDDGLDGIEETRSLGEGVYALLCVDDDGVRPASSLTVRPG